MLIRSRHDECMCSATRSSRVECYKIKLFHDLRLAFSTNASVPIVTFEDPIVTLIFIPTKTISSHSFKTHLCTIINYIAQSRSQTKTALITLLAQPRSRRDRVFCSFTYRVSTWLIIFLKIVSELTSTLSPNLAC